MMPAPAPADRWQLRPLPPGTKLGWCAHHTALLSLVRTHRPVTYVELGTWRGLSASLVAREVRQWDGTVYCVDTWAGGHRQGPSGPGRRHPAMIEDCAVHLVTEDVGSRVRLIVSQTADAARAWHGPPIDALYIDADHSYAGVWEDLTRWVPLVRSGGVICGDDYDRYGYRGLRRAWDQYEADTGQPWTREGDRRPGGRFIWGVKP